MQGTVSYLQVSRVSLEPFLYHDGVFLYLTGTVITGKHGAHNEGQILCNKNCTSQICQDSIFTSGPYELQQSTLIELSKAFNTGWMQIPVQ